MNDLTAQVLGILALVAMVLSYQQKDRKRLLWFQLASNALFVAHYYLIDAPTMSVMCIVNVARSFVFSQNDTRWGTSRLWLYLFLALTLAGGIWMWEGPLSLLVIVATLLLTVTLYSDNLAFMRKMFLVVPLLYIAYNIASGSVGGIGNDVFCIISALIAIWRFDIRKKASEEASGTEPDKSEEA
ncbi:MAG: YgjV family protein [Spirochaetales bacterium]|nr:YgjV family protein [Spirochaetales bacterium]